MAGETVKSEAICLSIAPWSRTSHVVAWLTPTGRVGTIVKGAVRPKSAFLGQYDLNYTCEIVYYARAKGDLHALRECSPRVFRERLRGDFVALALAGYVRLLADRFAPPGEECEAWYLSLAAILDRLAEEGASIPLMLKAELLFLRLLGLDPALEASAGAFLLRGERKIVVSPDLARCFTSLSEPLTAPFANVSDALTLDAARVLGVYYEFHVDGVSDVRRAVLKMVQNKTSR